MLKNSNRVILFLNLSFCRNPLPFLTEEPTIAEVDDLDANSESTMSTAMSTVGTQIPSTLGTFAGSTTSLKSQPLRKVLTSQWLKSQSQNIANGTEGGNKSRRTSATEAPKVLDDEGRKLVDNSSLKTDFMSASYASQLSGLPSAPPPAIELNSNLANLPRVIPKWKCYIKSFTATHIMLCFVPASFDDLRLLVQGLGIVQFSRDGAANQDQCKDREESSPPFIDVDGVECVQKVKKVHVSGNKAEGSGFPQSIQPDFGGTEHELASDQEIPTLNFDKYKDVDVTAGQAEEAVADERPADIYLPEVHEQRPEPPKPNVVLPDNYKGFVIPVYTYNCPLNSLTEQLINKWTYKSPADIYQDLTFSPECEDKTQEGEGSQKEVGFLFALLLHCWNKTSVTNIFPGKHITILSNISDSRTHSG